MAQSEKNPCLWKPYTTSLFTENPIQGSPLPWENLLKQFRLVLFPEENIHLPTLLGNNSASPWLPPERNYEPVPCHRIRPRRSWTISNKYNRSRNTKSRTKNAIPKTIKKNQCRICGLVHEQNICSTYGQKCLTCGKQNDFSRFWLKNKNRYLSTEIIRY